MCEWVQSGSGKREIQTDAGAAGEEEGWNGDGNGLAEPGLEHP